MQKLLSLLFLVLLSMCAAGVFGDTDSTFAQNKPLSLSSIVPNAQSIPRYGKLELTLNLTATYVNPFDPDQIDVEARFTSPSGGDVKVAGFLYQPYTSARSPSGDEKMTAAGPPYWMVRFAPSVVGVWHYKVTAKDASGIIKSKQLDFKVTASANPGYVKVSRKNPRAFAFDGERPFFAVGEDMCWGGGAGTYSYADWLPKLHEAGGNWIRVWMWPYSNGLEWSATATRSTGGFHGLGVYNLANAWHLDRTLDIVEANKMYCMICLGTFGELSEGGFFHEGQWSDNPYNAANGGPCQTAADYWTNPLAQKMYKQRLRYIMARYGYRTCIQSWELWNETWAPADWVKVMGQYIKGTGPYAGSPADPYRHLLTTTYGKDDVWSIPEIDWTQSHLYGVGDIADLSIPIAADASASKSINKPHLMAEFGIDYRKSDVEYDKAGKGIDLHNGIWSAAAAGDAGSAMIWWWDSYVAPKNLYYQYSPLAKTAGALPWTSRPWQSIAASPTLIKSANITYGPMTLSGSSQWGKAPESDFKVDVMKDNGKTIYPGFLYSPAKADLRTVPTFHVEYPIPGQFTVHIYTVSEKNTLHMLLDGRVANEVTLDAVPPADKTVTPPYKSTTLQPQYSTYDAVYDQDYSINVPSGQHIIQLDLSSGDWVSVSSYTLTNYRTSQLADINLWGVTDGTHAFVWVQNSRHNWKNDQTDTAEPVISAASTIVHGLKPGAYTLRWINTTTGDVFKSARVKAAAGGLTLSLPDVSTDIAATIRPN